jgi:hypothetical protein
MNITKECQKLEIAEEFIKLQGEQNQALSTTKDAKQIRDIIDRYSKEWNKFIEKYPDVLLNFSNHQFNTEINCSNWNIPKCEFYNVIFNGEVNFCETNFSGEVRFTGSKFMSKCSFKKAIFLKRAFFCKTTFNCIAKFGKSNFFIEAKFRAVVFKEMVSFNGTNFENGFRFEDVIFEGDVGFFSAKGDDKSIKNFFYVKFCGETRFISNKKRKLDEIKIFNIEITDSVFKDRVWFGGYNFTIKLRRSEFEKAVYFDGWGGRIDKIDLRRTVFCNIVIFDIPFKSFPDFSQTIFYKLPLINETWSRIIKSEVKEKEEPQFRFFKDHFLQHNDHQKELEYFELEMIAKERSLPFFQKIPYYVYNITSSYGNSIIRPLWWLMVSFISFGRIFSENFSIKNPYFASFTRTIFPVIQADKVFLLDDYEKIASGVLISQTIINSILLFLLLLGIRNKFKIK